MRKNRKMNSVRDSIFAEIKFMASFRDLKIWQKAILLTANVYRCTTDFPQSELFGLTSQMRRSAVSIPSNIAEGYGRRTDIELRSFLRIAIGSLYELQTQIEIAMAVGFLTEAYVDTISAQTRELEAMLIAFEKGMTT